MRPAVLLAGDENKWYRSRAYTRPVNPLARARHLVATMENWPVAFVDRAGVRGTVQYKTRTGVEVRCRSRTSDGPEAVVVLGGLEYPTELLHVEDGATIVDVGANIGAFALLASLANPGVRFQGIALEPYPPSALLARHNLAANGFTMFDVVEVAIAGFDGQAFLRTDQQPDRMFLDRRGEPVGALKLSTFCRSRDISHRHLEGRYRRSRIRGLRGGRGLHRRDHGNRTGRMAQHRRSPVAAAIGGSARARIRNRHH